jgi:ribulose 1,5-bisphosphate synthetase/thiazole synthase
MGKMPMSTTGQYLEFTKQIRLVPPCDVLVVGGGISGSMAALSAARRGARVVLLERYGFVGGTPVTNAGAHYCFCGDTAGQGQLFDELVANLEELDGIVPYEPWKPEAILRFSHERWDYSVARYFDATMYQLALQEMLLQAKGLELLLHSQVVDVVTDAGQVTAAVFFNPSGLQAIRPRIVVDCTGDANVAAAAGFACTSGRDGDGMPVPMSLCLSLRDVGEPVQAALPSWSTDYREAAHVPMAALTLDQDRLADFRIKVVGHDPIDGQGLTQAEVTTRRKVPGIVHFLQGHGYPTYKLGSISTQIGIRIGRRIVGEYILSEWDVRKGRRFADGIARGTCNLSDRSLMDSSTDKQTDAELDVVVVPEYQIPYRSLVPRGSRNLLVAGRCLSADWRALSSARMMPACAMMGQAVGAAAASCASTGQPVMDVDVPALQAELRGAGAVF